MKTHLDLCSGIAGFALAASWNNYTTIGFCEIDPFCQRVIAHHFPGVPIHDDLKTLTGDVVRGWLREQGDVSLMADATGERSTGREVHACNITEALPRGKASPPIPDHQGWTHGTLDLLTAGYPCFVAGTMVLTRDGYRPIESLAIGDSVLTHLGRWRNVTDVMQRTDADLVRVDAQGVPGVVTTPDHPFYGKRRRWYYPRLPEGKRGQIRIYESPEWIEAETLSRDVYLAQVLPETTDDQRSFAFWWLVGRILADGWIGDRPGREGAGRVSIACAENEADDLGERIAAAGYHANRGNERATVRFSITRNDIYQFMQQFGRYAHGKLVPGWVLELDTERSNALLSGWLSGDGYRDKNGWRGTTVSKALALGMALVAQRARGVVASVRLCSVPDRTVIEGRTVNQRPFYVVSVPDRNHVAVVDGAYGWKQFRRVAPAGVGTVYNISVDEDESYVADGAVVHNCQPFSHAGKRLGAEDDRHLWPFIAGLVADLRPRWCLFENVGGHVSMGLDDVLADLEALGYAWGAAIVPACAVGAPHRRDRIWIVAADTSESGRRTGQPNVLPGQSDTEGSRELLADTAHGGIRRGGAPRQPGLFAFGGEVVADADRPGWQQQRRAVPNGAEHSAIERDGERQTLRRLGQPHDGLSRQLARYPGRTDPRWHGDPLAAFGPEWEDGVPRVIDHELHRVAKLKALGNAIVPQVAYVIIASMGASG